MKRILVVDDNNMIADLAEIILQTAGYSCTKVNEGRKCLDIIREAYKNNNNYDLVLLDIAMPQFSGLDVLKAIQEEGYLSHNKVILFTASSATNLEIEDFKKMGALDCLRKPFSKANLLDFVKKYLPE
ncbi:response regulator [Nitrososphaera viennensis]|uniref:Response regulator n=2 Tax=Nitrososphaera viennensis TaxID=1034015 RepID=A0A977NL39_9ARCH|nr:response regulator [Nitrososphaera viennensis]AIC16394.1 putative Polar-differentiation response regulator divK [Nitrososphaera viennensis EN76]UVS68328.1 response regulator [Nitrososphaera viennensis]